MKLAALAAALALVVVLLGAWTRLEDAGLGCPDWPGCYGHFTVPTDAEALARARELFPDQAVVAEKAWPEMIHRHFAKALGLLILIMTVVAWMRRKQGHPVLLPTLLLVLVCFQGALGAWTVTLKLWPVVVMAHLLGGMLTFSLLCVTALQMAGVFRPAQVSSGLRALALVALLTVFAQVALGGWTSSNYAALSCTEFPVCQGDWATQGDFREGFKLHYPGEKNYEFGLLEHDARMAIHATHRIGAYLTIAVLGLFVWLLWRQPGASQAARRRYALLVAGLLGVQVTLGVLNVVKHLPLPNAVAHNGVGVLLFMTLLAGNVWLATRARNGQ